MRVRCKFSTKPKLNLSIKRPTTHPKGYPIKPKTLGEKIRRHRMDLGWFQKDVAKFVDVKTDTVTLWEKGRTIPNKKHQMKLKNFLKIKKF